MSADNSARDYGSVTQDYLKLIWSATEWGDPAITTTQLAERLGVSTSTASGQLRKLARDGLIQHEPYRAIDLTDSGRALALQMVRRHRLIETWLVNQLGYAWDEVHDEAEHLEHAVSDLLCERLDATLGHPDADPHGDPIPRADGTLPDIRGRRLSDLEPGVCGVITRVNDSDPDLLRFLGDRDVRPAAHLRVIERHDSADVVVVTVEATQGKTGSLTLASAAASGVWLDDRPHPHR